MNMMNEPLSAPPAEPAEDWSGRQAADLIDHILQRYHERHRQQLPELIGLAAKVEQVHAERPDCPAGLADRLRAMLQELESHMRKEEQILFPMISRGHGAMAASPIAVMRMEHNQHGDALSAVAALTHDMTLPEGACATWQALYQGLRTFRDDLDAHIQLENDILFESALGRRPAQH